MKSYQLVIIGLLIGLILVAGLSIPAKSGPLLTNPDPTPTTTPQAEDGPTVFESGDTQGLMVGAGVIVLIILSGVYIQRLLTKPKSTKLP